MGQLGLQRSRYFYCPDAASKLTLEAVTRLDMEASLLHLLGFRLSFVGLVPPVFYLPRCDGATGFDRSIKATGVI